MKNQVEILLVEDDPRDEELTLIALEENNLANKIKVVRDGEEALDYIFCRGKYSGRTNRNPSLVLLDLKLPKLNGIEVLRAIRSYPATTSIPVVVMTSSKEHTDLKACYGLYVNSYIVKPVDFEQFNKMVKDIGYYWVMVNEPPP